MADSPSWLDWGRAGGAATRPPARLVRGHERMTALDVLCFATAVMMIIVYSQCWLMAVQGDQGGGTDSALVMTTLGGVVIAARWRWSRLTEVIAAAHALLALASLIAALAFPAFGVMHQLFPGAWRGLWVEKNLLGGNMTIGVIACTAAAL